METDTKYQEKMARWAEEERKINKAIMAVVKLLADQKFTYLQGEYVLSEAAEELKYTPISTDGKRRHTWSTDLP